MGRFGPRSTLEAAPDEDCVGPRAVPDVAGARCVRGPPIVILAAAFFLLVTLIAIPGYFSHDELVWLDESIGQLLGPYSRAVLPAVGSGGYFSRPAVSVTTLRRTCFIGISSILELLPALLARKQILARSRDRSGASFCSHAWNCVRCRMGRGII